MTKNKLDVDLLNDYIFNEYFFSNPDQLTHLIDYIQKDINETKKIEDSEVFVTELTKVLEAAKHIQTKDNYKVMKFNQSKKNNE